MFSIYRQIEYIDKSNFKQITILIRNARHNKAPKCILLLPIIINDLEATRIVLKAIVRKMLPSDLG